MRKNSEIDTMESLVVPSFLAFYGQTYNHLLEGVLGGHLNQKRHIIMPEEEKANVERCSGKKA